MSVLTTILGDPSKKQLKSYEKEVTLLKKRYGDYTAGLSTIELIQERTEKLRGPFRELKTQRDASLGALKSEMNLSAEERRKQEERIQGIYTSGIAQQLESIKLEALAVHKRCCELMFEKPFTQASGEEVIWNMIPYDVQLIGALALNDGNIAEMKTGEGKTLVATIAAYLNALTGNPVHIVTVNDYLARRDADEMGILFSQLGLTTGVITHSQSTEEKQNNYQQDIVYATNNELGFDYLRDNMAPNTEAQSQGVLTFAIIDEVDSILVDEARTPLIISSPDNEPTSKYLTYRDFAQKLQKGEDYKVDEKAKAATLTEAGIGKIESFLGVENIFVSDRFQDLHHIENALKAASVYQNDREYIVREGNVMIIDEHTGRVLPGRRFSNGLHQALEAKENVEIQRESKTLASITFQNFFRLYEKLAGMTGTAKTEEEEFQKIYNLDVVVVPTNKPITRDDRADLLFKNQEGKFAYLVNEIEKIHQTGQPLLIGTVSVDKSEYLSDLLRKKGLKHTVLNAKQDASEAEIVGVAGQKGAITIATNMAGRGTDIKLGEGVRELGGLYVIATEKHETRRIDNQLRGRSGRQGDPGITQFLVSPQDDIMRIFGGERLFAMFNSPIFASMPDDEPLAQSGVLTRRIVTVQKQVEGRNFDIRKHILQYDDILNQHRTIMYRRRQRILDSFDDAEGQGTDIDITVQQLLESEARRLTHVHTDEDGKLRLESIQDEAHEMRGGKTTSLTLSEGENANTQEQILTFFRGIIADLETKFDEKNFDLFQRQVYLASIDELWMEHIDAMSNLREEVAFEGQKGQNPLLKYKSRAFEIFEELLSNIGYRTVRALLSSDVTTEVQQPRVSMEELQGFIESEKAAGTSRDELVGKLNAMGVQVRDDTRLRGHDVDTNNTGVKVKRVGGSSDAGSPTPQESHPLFAQPSGTPQGRPGRPLPGARQVGKNNKKSGSKRKKKK